MRWTLYGLVSPWRGRPRGLQTNRTPLSVKSRGWGAWPKHQTVSLPPSRQSDQIGTRAALAKAPDVPSAASSPGNNEAVGMGGRVRDDHDLMDRLIRGRLSDPPARSAAWCSCQPATPHTKVCPISTPAPPSR